MNIISMKEVYLRDIRMKVDFDACEWSFVNIIILNEIKL